MIDAEQDFGSQASDDYDEDDIDTQNQIQGDINLQGEWSPKQYSVSSNHDDEEEAIIETGVALPYNIPHSDDEEEDDEDYCDTDYQQTS